MNLALLPHIQVGENRPIQSKQVCKGYKEKRPPFCFFKLKEPHCSDSYKTMCEDAAYWETRRFSWIKELLPYYMKFWRHVNLAILKNPYLATL